MVPHASKAAARAEARKGITTDFRDLGLHSACANGNIGLVKYALANGQPINSVLNGVLPLHAAASSGNEPIVRMLIENGADVNAPRLPRRYSSEKTRSSIAVGSSGSTALHFAAANGHDDVIRTLLAFGANSTLKEKYGLTPEALALQNGHEETARLLREGTDEAPDFGDDPSTSKTSLKALRKKKISPQKSLDSLALKMSQQASNPHLPSLSIGPSTPSFSSPLSAGSRSRAGSMSSSINDDRRRLPAVLETAHSLKAAFTSLASGHPQHQTEPIRVDEETLTSPISPQLSRNNSTSSYNSRAPGQYRPRLSSNLSGRRVPIEDEEEAARPTSAESSSNVRTASNTLFRPHVRDRSSSNASSGSSYSRAPAVSPFARAHPAVSTRGSRSNSVGTTDARSSSSPSSSYSGFGTYAPSATTTAATSPSLAPSTFAFSTIQQPLNALSPLYESSNPIKRSDTSSSTITTSAEAHSHAKKMERDILTSRLSSSPPKPSSTATPSTSSKSALAQKLAAYGQTLSLEKKLKAMELGGPSASSSSNAAQQQYRWETIGKDGTHQETPVTAGQLRPPAEIVSSSTASSAYGTSPKPSKSPSGRRLSTEEAAAIVPHWKAVPSGDRLVPPSVPFATNRQRSASPSASGMSSTTPSSSAMSRNRTATTKDRMLENRPASPASTSGSSSIRASGVPAGTNTLPPNLTYEVISSPQSSPSVALKGSSSSAKPTGSAAAATSTPRSKAKGSSSDKALSAKGGSSVTSAKEQIAIDAAEQARIDATIPHAPITVPPKKKRFF